MPKAQPKPAAAGPANKALSVVSKTPSFWRAGLQFSHEPRTVLLADITPEQAEAIRDEDMLLVTEVDVGPAQG